ARRERGGRLHAACRRVGTARAGTALARRAGPHRHHRGGAGRAGRRAGEDRGRSDLAGTDGGWGGRGKRRARQRRLLGHAAEAQRLVQAAARQAAARGVDLRQAAPADEQIRAVLPDDALARALEPTSYLGSTNTFIDRALALYRTL